MATTSLKQRLLLSRLKKLAALHSLEVRHVAGNDYAELVNNRNYAGMWDRSEVHLYDTIETWMVIIERITQ